MSLQNEERLNKVLELLLLPNYSIASSTYFDLLLTHISEHSKNSAEYHIYRTWVPRALDTWKNNNSKPCQAVATFTLKLVGLVAENELHFQHWQKDDVYTKLFSIFELQKHDLSASIKTAYVTMLCSFLPHRSGREWIIQSGVWKAIVDFAQLNHTIYVTRECKKFLTLFLVSECQNVPICEKVILAICAPLINTTLNTQIIPALEDSYMDQNRILCATLDLITYILEETMFTNVNAPVPLMFERLANLEVRVKALFEACLSTRFLQHVHKLIILIIFMKLQQGIRGKDKTIEDSASEKFRIDIHYINIMLLSKKCVLDVLRTFKISLIYWKKTRAICEFQMIFKHRFEHQVIAITVLPLCACLKKSYINCDLFDTYLTTFFHITCITVQRLAYSIRDILLKEDVNVEQICKVSIEFMLEMVNIMDRDVAVIAFQTMCHVLKNYTLEPEEMQLNVNLEQDTKRNKYKALLDGDAIANAPNLLSSLLHALVTFTEKFKIKWPESVETICLMNLSIRIVNHPAVATKTSVQALKLTRLAIQNFMPPNLALLVDSGNYMSEVGATLFKRLHDPNWEICDSVLEVLNTIAIISENKFPGFQNFLLENPFLQVATDLITADTDSYVRASALSFIATSVRIIKLWESTLSKLDLLDIAIKLINKESEAIVRREAVVLINSLYMHRRWSKSQIEVMSNAMAVAAVLDLHWEVKINALEYWKHFISSHLTDQGMLDGSFPKVTFSKEHKKIVFLNEVEIKQRLNKALDELAEQSCLGVLLATLKDDSDFEVCKTSAQIISEFKNILLKYKLDKPLPNVLLPKDSAVLDTKYVKQIENAGNHVASRLSSSDTTNVIEAIVDANDANLLASIYKESMKMNEDSDTTEQQTLKQVRSVTRRDFMQTILNTDIEAYIFEKDHWLKNYNNSFESTLDDILTISQQSDMNLMDCY